ncbi:cyclophane-forming radical SAM peptide maturase AmcB [Streptomyces malaysiensis]|uniref:Radical sam domain protein n=1 Tax=Streptomyces malaysiensis TaxID=92644 RepID=A0A7X6B0D2_STRMQ|nr:cyclophane-forming radical SAM peptide maturase AmcB [Streptomyces malaysiensis]NIY68406.1 radical sam domain protein [Streptomyces malaysiensis]
MAVRRVRDRLSVRPATSPSLLFAQPTALCNLDCSYCYLPDRADARVMSPEVADAMADGVRTWAGDHPVRVLWHGGEPLTVGVGTFTELLSRFPERGVHPIRHAVQTNATLIDDAWCDVFERSAVEVAVSIDGPGAANGRRTDRGGRPTAERTLKGIDVLRRRGIAFDAIAVVSEPSAERARELYAWFAMLGTRTLGVNLVERKGAYRGRVAWDEREVVEFWSALLACRRSDGRMRIRDLDHALRYLRDELDGRAAERATAPRELAPMVMWNGALVPTGPELAGFTSPRHGALSIGDITRSGLAELMERAAEVPWVAEVLDGFTNCRTGCDHFAFCRGGNAANKFFETGRFDTTETTHCRTSKKLLMEGVFQHVAEARE